MTPTRTLAGFTLAGLLQALASGLFEDWNAAVRCP